MNKFRYDLLLLLAAVIWGFAFVAQRIGMDYIGPFAFNGIRFALGAIVVLPFLFFKRTLPPSYDPAAKKTRIAGVVAAGLFLFGGVTLQQLGLQTTTAGKAGFITGLYVVFVPLAGIFLKQRIHYLVWTGVILSASGLYLLSVNEHFIMEYGDLLVLMCAFLFTGHVLTIGWISPKMDTYRLAFYQFLICSVLNLILALLYEKMIPEDIIDAAIPLIYGGVLSVGIAYTLQVVAQKHSHAAYASIIMSLEVVFAAFGGWLILGENLTDRSLFGCFLMLSGMIIVQIRQKF